MWQVIWFVDGHPMVMRAETGAKALLAKRDLEAINASWPVTLRYVEVA
jgi:hypothetical protein